MALVHDKRIARGANRRLGLGNNLLLIVHVHLHHRHHHPLLPPQISDALCPLLLLATMLAMYAIGMVVAAVAPTPNSAVAIGLVGFLGLGALGGMFGPRDALPDWVARIGDALPFGAGVDALGAAWAGQQIDAANLVSLTVTIVVGAAVSALFFRWE